MKQSNVDRQDEQSCGFDNIAENLFFGWF